jgi:hypothetical protein
VRFIDFDALANLRQIFEHVLKAESWRERELNLSKAYELVADMHNQLGVTVQLDTRVSQFHRRPYMVLDADRFVGATLEDIKTEEVRSLPPHLGAVDQFIDSTDVLTDPALCRSLRACFQ